MNFKTTGILVLALAALLGYYFWSQYGAKPAPTQDQALSTSGEGNKLFPFDLISVDRVVLTTPDGTRTTIQRTGDGWNLTEPVQAQADPQSVIATVDAILSLRSRGQPASDPGQDTGLDKPRYTVQLHTTGGKTSTLTIGEKAGVGDVLYAQVDGGAITLIDGQTTPALDQAEKQLRDKHLLRFDAASIKQVELASGSDRLSLANVDGQWQILEPQKLKADNDQVLQWLGGVANMQASDFLTADSDELAFARFDQPTLVLRMSMQPPATQPASQPTTSQSDLVLTIGAPASLAKSSYFVRTGDGLYAKVAPELVTGLQRMNVAALRDRTLATIAPEQVTAIQITADTFALPAPGSNQPAPKAPLSEVVTNLIRPPAPVQGPFVTRPSVAAAEWQFAGDAKSEVDEAKVHKLLALLNPLRADSFLTEAPTGPIEKKYKLVLTTAAGQTEIDVQAPSGDEPGFGIYNQLMFQVSRTLQAALAADYHQGADEPPGGPQ
jgi:hypothetical protein